MKLLVLGGTRFLGRAVVEEAVTAGHDVTVFNRGRHDGAGLPPVEHLRGDRYGDLSALRGGRWDAVVDTFGFVPSNVAAVAAATDPASFVFISTQAVYDAVDGRGPTESDAVRRATPDEVRRSESVREVAAVPAETFGSLYGPLKAACEEAAADALPGRVMSLRPGLIVGPHDYAADRFMYWTHRVARGGEILAVGPPDRQVRFVDVRDLGRWIVALCERRDVGVLNATGPTDEYSTADLLDACATAIGTEKPHVTWASEAFALEHGVVPWRELPLWRPGVGGTSFNTVDLRQATALGLHCRPAEDTIADTWEWLGRAGVEPDPSYGLDPTRERELLASWHAQASAITTGGLV